MTKGGTILALCDSIHVYRMQSGLETIYQTSAEQMEMWKRIVACLSVGQRVVIEKGRPPRIENE